MNLHVLKKANPLLLFIALCLLPLYKSIAQEKQPKVDSAHIFLNSELPLAPEFLELLVTKAQTYYPEKDQFEHGVEKAEKEKNLTNIDFLNNFVVRGNLNEFTINPPEGPAAQNLFFPRYNIGLGFSLGTFFTQPLNKKIARQELYIKESEKEVYYLQIKTEVLTRFMTFKSTKAIYLIQTKALDDANSKMAVYEDQFKNDQLSYESYLNNLDEVNAQKIKTIMAERDYEIAKIRLEELIGGRIEDVIKEYKKSCE